MEFVKQVKQDVLDIFQRSSQEIKNKINYHYYLQHRIVELAAKYHLIGGEEYGIPHFRDRRHGKLDGAWIAANEKDIFAIFEIDSALRKKSIEKLTYLLDIPYRFWIYYGNRNRNEVYEFLRRNDPDRIVNVIIYDKIHFER